MLLWNLINIIVGLGLFSYSISRCFSFILSLYWLVLLFKCQTKEILYLICIYSCLILCLKSCWDISPEFRLDWCSSLETVKEDKYLTLKDFFTPQVWGDRLRLCHVCRKHISTSWTCCGCNQTGGKRLSHILGFKLPVTRFKSRSRPVF